MRTLTSQFCITTLRLKLMVYNAMRPLHSEEVHSGSAGQGCMVLECSHSLLGELSSLQ